MMIKLTVTTLKLSQHPRLNSQIGATQTEGLSGKQSMDVCAGLYFLLLLLLLLRAFPHLPLKLHVLLMMVFIIDTLQHQ